LADSQFVIVSASPHSGLFCEREAALSSPIVLCIDNRSQVLELRKAALEPHDYCVKIAHSSYSAMRILDEAPVAAVLLEYTLEGMDAEAVAFHIKQRFPGLPVIMISAYSEMPERILWLVDEYVMKSELPDGLVRIIERATRPKKSGPRSGEPCKPSTAAA
jgi:DNA-binding NtrC family response regulator